MAVKQRKPQLYVETARLEKGAGAGGAGAAGTGQPVGRRLGMGMSRGGGGGVDAGLGEAMHKRSGRFQWRTLQLRRTGARC